MKISASVVIPCYGRSELVSRAYHSVLSCDGAERVEIIVVDDCSPEAIEVKGMRGCDKILRLTRNSGGAVARNRGIEESVGGVIFLLDSDDIFLKRDFSDLAYMESQKGIYFTDIKSKNYESKFPSEVSINNFIKYALNDYPYICQTSSLAFHRSLGLRFDESLPKHQDWDFVLAALYSGVSVKKMCGDTFFDRSDKKSISRSKSPAKSKAFQEKLESHYKIESCLRDMFELVIFGPYRSEYDFNKLLVASRKALVSGMVGKAMLGKIFIKRVLYLLW